MLADGQRSGLDRVRGLVALVPVPLVLLSLSVAVWKLSGGQPLASTIARGYAEAQPYSIAPIAGGAIASLAVDIGDEVKAGAVIAKMDSKELDVQLAQAKAELGRLQAQLVAQSDIVESEVTRSEIWVVKTRAEMQADRAEATELEQRLQRLSPLLDKKLVSLDDIEATRRPWATRKAEIATIDRAIATGNAGFADAGGRSKAAVTHKAAVELRLAPYRDAIHVQEEIVRGLELQIDRLALRAPVDGRVALVLRRPGEVVAAYTEVLRIVTARAGMVVVQVDEHLASEVALGSPVQMARRSGGVLAKWLGGKVVAVGPDIQESLARVRPSPNIPIWGRTVFVKLDGAEALLPGEAFDVRFH